jgi:hypothetical protein
MYRDCRYPMNLPLVVAQRQAGWACHWVYLTFWYPHEMLKAMKDPSVVLCDSHPASDWLMNL